MADTRKHRGKWSKGQEADDSTTLATLPVAPAETNLQVDVPGPDALLVSAGPRKSPVHEMRDKQQALRRELRQASAAKLKARKALNLTKKALQHVNPADKRKGAARARRRDKLQERLAAIAAKGGQQQLWVCLEFRSTPPKQGPVNSFSHPLTLTA